MKHDHEQALDAICGCGSVTILSYQEAIEGYLTLREIPLSALDDIGDLIEAARTFVDISKSAGRNGEPILTHTCRRVETALARLVP